MFTVNAHTTHGPINLGAEPTICPGLVVTPALGSRPGIYGPVYSGLWSITHVGTGRRVSDGHCCADPAEAHRMAAGFAALGLDWTHPDPRQWPAADTARVTAFIRAHISEQHTALITTTSPILSTDVRSAA